MHIETFVLGQLQTNCYLVWDEKTKETIIIDPADEGDYIATKILEKTLLPKGIIVTHGHFDHLLAATELKLAFNIPFLINQKDLFLLNRVQSSSKKFTGIQADPPPFVDRFVQEGDEIFLGSVSFKVIDTPGHTPGSICLYTKDILFSGDTLFLDGVGRTDLSYSSESDLHNSIKNKILRLPEKTIVYPGHGNSTIIKREKLRFFSN